MCNDRYIIIAKGTETIKNQANAPNKFTASTIARVDFFIVTFDFGFLKYVKPYASLLPSLNYK